ncbi:hypothetical protein Tsubulata_000126 [Turnera subulata]|uniref:Endonuclease/exonuclease/phosphatase domain-containing protein n=1 Tax=Turnera subulata TaxID=218843 RepID=A0A9Q0FJF4_9ROSI|nr:hypothetical protein Tsubulata_000126 [Turnera subulata]
MFPIITWNVQGAGKDEFSRTFKEVCRVNKSEVVVIVEPRLSGIRASRIIRRLNFSHSHRIEARGFSGGIWLLWDGNLISVDVLFNHTQLMHVRLTKGNESFLFTAVYASPQEKWRRFCWKNIEALAEGISEPWLLAGDFNAVLAGHERKDRFGRNGTTNIHFRNCVVMSRLLEIDSAGSVYTWKGGGHQARLDRFLCNEAWRIKYPEAEALHLPRLCSDHRPILIRNNDNRPPKAQRPFRFQAAWLTHEEFASFVDSTWDRQCNSVEAIQKFIPAVHDWNKRVFGNILRRKKRLLARLAGIQRFLEQKPSIFLTKLEVVLRMELDQVLIQEELLWAQKLDANGCKKGIKIHHISMQPPSFVEGRTTWEPYWMNQINGKRMSLL